MTAIYPSVSGQVRIGVGCEDDQSAGLVAPSDLILTNDGLEESVESAFRFVSGKYHRSRIDPFLMIICNFVILKVMKP